MISREDSDQNSCTNCLKPRDLCVCEEIESLNNKVRVLILRHPQEQDKDLGTAQICHLSLKNSQLKTGLSWRNLKSVLGEEVVNKDWGVLYLGSAKIKQANSSENRNSSTLTVVDKKGNLNPESEKILRGLRGIVVLDGNWGQAKALWWRNPWLLKLHRLVLNPTSKSLYGKLRKEPRPDSVSTIEAVAMSLEYLEPKLNADRVLLRPFCSLLEKYRRS